MFNRSSLLRNLTFVADDDGGDSIEPLTSGKRNSFSSNDSNEPTSYRTTSSNIFRKEKFTFVTGRDVLSPTEKNGVNSNSSRASCFNARPRRRRKPTPDGYLHDDVNKGKGIETSTSGHAQAEFVAPSRIALNRGNHYRINRDIPSLSEEDLLCDGLKFVGYDETGIKQVKVEENVERFKSFYGVAPSAILFIKDLKEAHPSIDYRDVMMTCNFLQGDEVKRCMEPRWGRNKTYIGRTVRKYTKMFASLKYLKIKMDIDKSDADIIVYTVDGVNFATSEFRKHPSFFFLSSNAASRTIRKETFTIAAAIIILVITAVFL